MKTIRTLVTVVFTAALVAACSGRKSQERPTGTTGTASAEMAAGKSSVVFDAVGDATKQARGYQDIVRAEVRKEGASFVLVQQLAAPVPESPTVPSGVDVIDWVCGLDTDSTASPAGYPQGDANPWEFFVELRRYRPGFTDPLDPTRSAGILIDRRPLLAGGQATITPIKFSIEGARITWVVDAALLGDPATFKWGCGTPWAKGGHDVKHGYSDIELFDRAPDVGHVTWPQ